jgi:hypothetical protein
MNRLSVHMKQPEKRGMCGYWIWHWGVLIKFVNILEFSIKMTFIHTLIFQWQNISSSPLRYVQERNVFSVPVPLLFQQLISATSTVYIDFLFKRLSNSVMEVPMKTNTTTKHSHNEPLTFQWSNCCGGSRELKIWRPLSVTINLRYDNYFLLLSLFLITIKYTN